MNIQSIKTEKVTQGSISLIDLLDKYIVSLEEKSVVVITSKIVAICEGSQVKIGEVDKDDLVKQEADLYLPKEENQYNLFLTIKGNVLAVNAGIDESNSNGYYVLWPKNPQKNVNEIREHLTQKFNIKNLGVIITDSKTTALRTGITVLPIAHSGFKGIYDLVGTMDIFGRELKMTKVAVADALAGAAGFVMSEGAEQTPLAVITDIPYIEFQDRNPTEQELADLKIDIDVDVYSPILKSVDWKKR